MNIPPVIPPVIERGRLIKTLAHIVNAGYTLPTTPETEELCQVCDLTKTDVATRRLNAAYADDEHNWIRSCRDCYEDRVEYYRDLWANVDY